MSGDHERAAGLLLTQRDHAAFRLCPRHREHIGFALAGVERECSGMPHPSRRMLLDELDHFPRPRTPTGAGFQLFDVVARVVGAVAARDCPDDQG